MCTNLIGVATPALPQRIIDINPVATRPDVIGPKRDCSRFSGLRQQQRDTIFTTCFQTFPGSGSGNTPGIIVVDQYFGYCFGRLPYRSLRFEHHTLPQAQFQAVGTVNYPAEDVPYTRISEYKFLTGQDSPRTTITYEYPSADGDPYYPIPRPENQALFKRYEALGDATENVTFVGRLATYRYYNMDQIVGQALAAFRRLDAARAEVREFEEA